MSSFFYSLMSYSPRAHRKPWEDFFTEVFAEVLRSDSRLLPAILDEGRRTGQISGAFTLEPGTGWTVTTQYALESGRRPDIAVLRQDRPVLLIENKMGAPFTVKYDNTDGEPEDQISHYVRYARSLRNGCRVLLISVMPREVEEVDSETYLGNILWYDVYSALSGVKNSSDQRSNVLRKELLSLMEDMNMNAPRLFRFGDSRAFWDYIELFESFETLLKKVMPRLEKEFGISTDKINNKNKWGVYYPVKAGNLSFDIGIVFSGKTLGNKKESAPVWPYMDFSNESGTALEKIRKVLDTDWSDEQKRVYPSRQQVCEFHGAGDWAEQVEIAYKIWSSWLEKFRENDLIPG